jgi:IS30 family transposase
MGAWKHFTIEDRRKIETLIKEGFDYKEIGKIIQRPTETIKYEIKRNGGYSAYSSDAAHVAAADRTKEGQRKRIVSMRAEQEKNPFQVRNIINPAPKTKPESGIKEVLDALTSKLYTLIGRLDHLESAFLPFYKNANENEHAPH